MIVDPSNGSTAESEHHAKMTMPLTPGSLASYLETTPRVVLLVPRPLESTARVTLLLLRNSALPNHPLESTRGIAPLNPEEKPGALLELTPVGIRLTTHLGLGNGRPIAPRLGDNIRVMFTSRG